MVLFFKLLCNPETCSYVTTEAHLKRWHELLLRVLFCFFALNKIHICTTYKHEQIKKMRISTKSIVCNMT